MSLLLHELKKAREETGLSLAQIAKRSGIDKAALSRLENGRHDNPTLETILRYLSAIGKDIEWRFVDAPAAK
jgi:transcriptional regulator with XRE-family HTH domain